MAVYRPFDDIALAIPGILAEHRKAVELAEHERAAVRLHALAAQSSPVNSPQVRITLPPRLAVDPVHVEQQRRSDLVPQ